MTDCIEKTDLEGALELNAEEKTAAKNQVEIEKTKNDNVARYIEPGEGSLEKAETQENEEEDKDGQYDNEGEGNIEDAEDGEEGEAE